MWPFDKKKGKEDPIMESHKEEATVAFNEDTDSIRDSLYRQYPSAESAIEDYRKGYISNEQLQLRFTAEEIELIYKEKEERDRDDKEIPTGFQ
jgi:hypothetical protein